nr:MAG TPA: hypothetical protein [Caudoviricetes sp.]
MKKIVRGNDFTLRVPVRRIVNGEKERFPLPACEEIEVNLVNAFRRRKMEYTIGVEDDSLLEVSVHSSEMALGSYALEVKGKLFGSSWRSNEYEQLQLVDNNASGDTEFGETDEGEDSVEMDTAIVVLAPVIVIDGDIEVLKDEIANGVRDGAWLPVKAGRDANGNVVSGAVAEGLKTIAKGVYSHAEGAYTKALGDGSHVEGWYTTASDSNSHAEGFGTTAIGHSSHAEGRSCTVSGYFSHAQGCYNYDDKSFIDMVGVGNNSTRKNASVIYVRRRGNIGLDVEDPKNGYQYLLDVGGYKGQAVENGMKSVQEVFADHDSRITAVEKGGSVKKSKPKIEYVVGRAIKCSLLTCSSNDRVRYIVPSGSKTISLLVGNYRRSLLAKNGDSIKVKFVTSVGYSVSCDRHGIIDRFNVLSKYYTLSIDSNYVITITNITNDNYALNRVALDINFNIPEMRAWCVSNVTLGDDGVYVVTLDNNLPPDVFDTASPYRKFENGIVVNKRLPIRLSLGGAFLDIETTSFDLITYRFMNCRTRWIERLGKRLTVKKIRRRKFKYGVCNIVVKHGREKKSCYMQTWVINMSMGQKRRLH